MARPKGAKDKRKRKSRTNKIIAGSAALAVLGAGAYGASKLKGGKKILKTVKNKTKPKVNTSSVQPYRGNKLPPAGGLAPTKLQEKRARFEALEYKRQTKARNSKTTGEKRTKFLKRILSSNEKKVIDGSRSTRKRLGKSGISTKAQKIIRRKRKTSRN